MILVGKIAALLVLMAFLHFWSLHLNRPRQYRNLNKEVRAEIDSLIQVMTNDPKLWSTSTIK